METVEDNSARVEATATPKSSTEHAPVQPVAHHPKASKGKKSSLFSSYQHSVPPHVAYPHRVKQLAIVFFLLIALAAGFLGGWLGSSSHDAEETNDGSLVTNSKQTIVTTESQAITAIAKNVSSGSSSSTNSLFDTSGGTTEDAGTGIILTADGLILTNRHVIPDGTTSVSVILSDGTTYSNVQVVGRTSDDSSLDIAFLKIQNTNGKQLVPVNIGDSSKMEVGNPVVAIGNALGQFQNTVTSGIISGYGRSVEAGDSTGDVSENLDDLFQTDAAINEGNSGGPLVNLNGQVIGINTAIASGSQNIGFAIPINDVTGLIQSVETTGKLAQPYLGVVFIPITSDIAQQYSLSVTNGAWIPPSSVVGQAPIVSGGPAANAGLQTGDIITAINGQAINQTTSLTSIIDKEAVGDQVTLSVNRSGNTMSIKVTLGSAPTTN
jgi:serine protease Do